MAQPSTTRKGITKRPIWIEEPTAIESDKSILSLTETTTAVTCSVEEKPGQIGTFFEL
jgi:hypothetical protein